MRYIDSGKEYQKIKFQSIDLHQDNIKESEFIDCVFESCDFSEGSLKTSIFENCKFVKTSFATSKFIDTRISDCKFNSCKLTGIDWSTLNKIIGLELDFNSCDLSYSSFFKMDLSNSKFIDCRIYEADFTECIMKNVLFKGSELMRTSFYNTDLQEADFREAVNYLFDPGKNNCKNAKFSYIEALNLLKFFGIIVE